MENTRAELSTLKPLLQKVTDDTKRLEEAIAKNTKIVEDYWKMVQEDELGVTTKVRSFDESRHPHMTHTAELSCL